MAGLPPSSGHVTFGQPANVPLTRPLHPARDYSERRRSPVETPGFRFLRSDLYRVEDGEEALQFLRHEGNYYDAPRPDLLLLNLNMPKVSGSEVLLEMKEDPMIRDIPSVVFSSSRLDADKAECLALGARDFIAKPSGLQEFLYALRRIIGYITGADTKAAAKEAKAAASEAIAAANEAKAAAIEAGD
jgi:CheY-like chemotaxis protein